MRKTVKRLSSIHVIMAAFFLVILVGSVLLSLPCSSADGKAVPYLDALFTATTSTCVTGLVTLPTVTTWSVFGQTVILGLIQIGGLGVITVGAGLMILLHRRIGLSGRNLISESFNLNTLGGIVRFVKKVITLSLIIELAGALAYMTVFIPAFGAKGVWISVFTSVSAFCNAGIDIIAENSLCNYALNPIVNITTMLLIILGGIGFIVLFDLEKICRSKNRRHLRFLSLHSKIVLCVTMVLLFSGALLFFLFEHDNPNTLQGYSVPQKSMLAFFQSVTTRTAGFATIPQENLTQASAFVSILLMFIGGSPTGTAGGIKTVALFVLLISAVSVINNKRTVDVFNRQISAEILKKAVAVFVTSLFIVLTSTALLLAFEGGDFLDILYETVSATATVGLTRNFTGSLSFVGKAIIIFTMYLGRVGPISLAFAFSVNKKSENIITNPIEEINVG